MGSEIKTSAAASAQAAATLRGGLDAYCSFGLTSLSLSDPVAGSQDHDGRLGAAVRSSLQAFSSLVTSDANAIAGVHRALASTDARLSKSM